MHSAMGFIMPLAAGVPVWWFTTLIPRAPLPHASMQRVDAAYNNSMLLLPAGVHVYLVEPGGCATIYITVTRQGWHMQQLNSQQTR